VELASVTEMYTGPSGCAGISHDTNADETKNDNEENESPKEHADPNKNPRPETHARDPPEDTPDSGVAENDSGEE